MTIEADGLRVLDACKLKWRLPEDPVAEEVLIPALHQADGFDCMVGYFGGQALRELAPGLASFISRATAPMRLLISPLLSDADLESIKAGLTLPGDVLAEAAGAAFTDVVALTNALATHTLHCLAYLLAVGRLQIKVVLVEDGIFHVKEWLLRAGQDIVVLSGSANFTGSAMTRNIESLHLHRSWRDNDNFDTCSESVAEFELLWCNGKSTTQVIDLPIAVADELISTYSADREPTEADFWAAREHDHNAGLVPERTPGIADSLAAKRLVIPDGLDWTNPPYGHQDLALRALGSHDYVGLVAIATGGGKTKTALLAISRIQDQNRRSMLVVILVPTKVLAAQWADEVRDFGVNPIVLSGSSPSARGTMLQEISLSLQTTENRTEVIIATISLFCQDDPLKNFVKDAASYSDAVLIADEAHNFGAPRFINDPPLDFKYRIGLSATPVRQYDAEGTTALYGFFKTEGDPVFTFSLGEAIKSKCLTPYRYLLHEVAFTDEEMDVYRDLSYRLARAGFHADDGAGSSMTDLQKRILRERRRLVENAGGKIESLRRLLAPRSTDINRTLIYCSAKGFEAPHKRSQIDLARDVLEDLRITTHKFTAAESRQAGSSAYLEGFALGAYQTLLAMKVLDEGVDIPAAREAFLLASSTVEREWVQRRGRVLRNSPGKVSADLHDFIVVPSDVTDKYAQTLIRSELLRAEHFAADAANKYSDSGPFAVIAAINEQFRGAN